MALSFCGTIKEKIADGEILGQVVRAAQERRSGTGLGKRHLKADLRGSGDAVSGKVKWHWRGPCYLQNPTKRDVGVGWGKKQKKTRHASAIQKAKVIGTQLKPLKTPGICGNFPN